MGLEKTTLEIIAISVEDAVTKGLNQLGLPEEAVEIEVLDTGSKGFLGLGTRQARVRLRIKDAEAVVQPTQRTKEEKPVKPRDKQLIEVEPVETAPTKRREMPAGELDEEAVLKIAEQVTGELLEKMHVRARLKAQIVPPADENDQSLVMVEVQGDDLSILIGRRSETLNALQYITSLIVAREAGKWVPLMIDVQGYRARRERQLRVLARRMADQVVHTGRRSALEPMPANERRIIHLELRDHPEVMTESVGEEPNRKVTILLKKQIK